MSSCVFCNSFQQFWEFKTSRTKQLVNAGLPLAEVGGLAKLLTNERRAAATSSALSILSSQTIQQGNRNFSFGQFNEHGNWREILCKFLGNMQATVYIENSWDSVLKSDGDDIDETFFSMYQNGPNWSLTKCHHGKPSHNTASYSICSTHGFLIMHAVQKYTHFRVN